MANLPKLDPNSKMLKQIQTRNTMILEISNSKFSNSKLISKVLSSKLFPTRNQTQNFASLEMYPNSKSCNQPRKCFQTRKRFSTSKMFGSSKKMLILEILSNSKVGSLENYARNCLETMLEILSNYARKLCSKYFQTRKLVS